MRTTPPPRSSIPAQAYQPSTLNDYDLARGYWMACDHPERPPDDGCCFHIAHAGQLDRMCKGCMIALEASMANGSPHLHKSRVPK